MKHHFFEILFVYKTRSIKIFYLLTVLMDCFDCEVWSVIDVNPSS